jgi:FHA domain
MALSRKRDGVNPETTAEYILVPEEPTRFVFADDGEDDDVTQVDDFARAGFPLQELPAGTQGSLTFLEGSEKGRVHRLEKPYNVIGRHVDCEIPLRALSVSGRHAAVFLTRALEWRLEDLGSKNGTLLNGSLVKAFALQSGDKIFIGDNLILFTLDEED